MQVSERVTPHGAVLKAANLEEIKRPISLPDAQSEGVFW